MRTEKTLRIEKGEDSFSYSIIGRGCGKGFVVLLMFSFLVHLSSHPR